MFHFTEDDLARLDEESRRAMRSAVWEYCPDELNLLIEDLCAARDEIARLQNKLDEHCPGCGL